VHEWLHQVEARYRGLDVGRDELPDLHAAADFTSTRPDSEPPFGRSYAAYHDGDADLAGARTWAPWYRDWMTGQLRPLSSDSVPQPSIGLTEERWARRSAVK
jgi:hypothetical protein